MSDRRKFLATGASLAAAATVAAAQPAAQPEDVSRIGRTAHTRFAVNLEMWWTRLPFLRRIEEAARLGFTAIEFWPFEGKDIDAIAQTCQKLNVEVAQFSAWGFRPGLNDPRNHNRFVSMRKTSSRVIHGNSGVERADILAPPV